MIILDLSQVFHAAIAVDFHDNKEPEEFNEDIVRYLVLNIIRAYKVKYEEEYGEFVVCCDGHRVWRRDIFPYYKYKRAENKKESTINWDVIHESFDKIREELKEVFPFPVVHLDKVEGDDVVATLCRAYPDEKIKILSSDKDFKQLHTKNITQYSTTLKKDIECEDPARQLRELILHGDGGDGVPNVWSADSYLALREKGDRAKSVTQKFIDESFEDLDAFLTKYDIERNYRRNEQLVDLSKIPVKYQEDIIDEYLSQKNKMHRSVMTYLIKHNQKKLSERISDFAAYKQKRTLEC